MISELSKGSRKPSTKVSAAGKPVNGANVSSSFDRNESIFRSQGKSKKGIKSSPRQTASTALDGLLIDLTPSSPPNVSWNKAKPAFEPSPIDLMQSSVAEKYTCLPLPVTEDPAYRKTGANTNSQSLTGSAYVPKRPSLIGQESPRPASAMSLKNTPPAGFSAPKTTSVAPAIKNVNPVASPAKSGGGIYYSCPPVEDENKSYYSTGAASVVDERKLLADKEKVNKAFGWLTDNVIGLSLTSSNESVDKVHTATASAGGPPPPVAPKPSLTQKSNGKYQNATSSSWKPNDQKTTARVLPVNAVRPSVGAKFQQTQGSNSSAPRAKSTSGDNRRTAVRPPVSGGGSTVTKTLLSLSTEQSVANVVSVTPDANLVNYDDDDDIDDFDDETDNSFRSDDFSDEASVTSPSASLSRADVRDKIDELKRRVHGVTEDQCQAALSSHSWDVDAATRYLKVEQMFGMGVATRDKCQRLLQEFGWNLELASDVLLEQYRSGSAV